MKSLLLLLTLTISSFSSFDLVSSNTTSVLYRRDTPKNAGPSQLPGPPEYFFSQIVDYNEGKATFQQRYWVNPDYYRPGGPAFLVISDYSNFDYNILRSHLLNTVARELGGVVFGLESRYAGKSWPVKDLKFENLRFSGSDHKLKDIERFIKKIEFPGKTARTKWVVAGNGYSGNLAAWSRLQMPNVVVGAIASSAPLKAKLINSDYAQILQDSVRTFGGEKCLNYHYQVIGEIDRILKSNRKSIEALKNKFSCDNVDDFAFIDELSFFARIALNHNDDYSLNNFRTYCKSLKLDGSLNEKFDEYIKNYRIANGNSTCQERAALFSKTINLTNKFASGRQAMYRSCTEFGHFAIASESPKKTLVPRVKNLDYILSNVCDNLIGKEVRPNTRLTNRIYHGDNLRTTNLILTMGQYDSNRGLSVNNGRLPNGMHKIEIKGATGYRDFHIPHYTDSLAVWEAKMNIISIATNWLRP